MAMRDDLIYLDYNATTPVDLRVSSVITKCMNEEFGNPSSSHAYGASAHLALEEARSQISSLIGANTSEIVFTGSGSESDALAIRGAVLFAKVQGHLHPHVITQVTEHPAVLAACRELEELHGVDVTYLPVDEFGRVDPAAVERAITPDTILISIMHANNEIGTLQPITEIGRIARSHAVLMHCDAAQSIGKIPVNINDLKVDMLTIVGHKMYAPKGIAALYVRNGIQLRPIVGGGGQEQGRRAGTENVAFAVGLGEAAKLAGQSLADGESERLAALRHRLECVLRAALPIGFIIHGHPTEHLPNTLNLRIDGIPALSLLAALPRIAASTGSACHEGIDEPSSVLTALGLSSVDALATIRLSWGRWTTEDEIDEAAAQIIATALSFRDK
jgi:cysteine desulfurase